MLRSDTGQPSLITLTGRSSYLTGAAGLQVALVIIAFASLNPYFMWGWQKVYYAVGTFVALAASAVYYRSSPVPRDKLLLAICCSLFLVYLSVLPKVDGGFTRWFLLIPFTAALLTARHEDQRKAFDLFYWIFSLSLVPGILIGIWVASGLPFTFEHMVPPREIVQRPDVDYLTFPGAVFIQYNATPLPNGGVLFRLCGIYDEPGTVGTIGALCLAATRFSLRDVRGALTFVGGVMAFSIAFAVIASIGLLVMAVISRRPWLLLLALVSLASGYLSLANPLVSDDTSRTTLTVQGHKSQELAPGADGSPLSESGVGKPAGESTRPKEADAPPPSPLEFPPGTRLRTAETMDNRAQPEMKQLFEAYLNSSAKTLLFGVASNASNVHSGNSATWMMVLTNYGVVGLAWLLLCFAMPLWYLRTSGQLSAAALLFAALFLMSFYQRPIIWLPAQLMIYFTGLYYGIANERAGISSVNRGSASRMA